MKQKYTVNLADCEIHIVTDEPREEVDAIVGAVDRRMREIHLHSKSCSRVDAALILCLEYCAEKSELQKKLRQANAEIERMTVLGEASARENAALEREIETLRASLELADTRRARRATATATVEPQLEIVKSETEAEPIREQNAVQRILSDDTDDADNIGDIADIGDAAIDVDEKKPQKKTAKKRATARKDGQKPQGKKVRAMFDMISFDDI